MKHNNDYGKVELKPKETELMPPQLAELEIIDAEGELELSGSVKVRNQKKRFIESLARNRGLLTKAYAETGIQSRQHHRWLTEDPAYCTALELVQDVNLDFAENALFDRMAKDTTAIIYYLNNKGKKRGYSPPNQVNATQVNNEIIVKPIAPKPDQGEGK